VNRRTDRELEKQFEPPPASAYSDGLLRE